MAEQNEREQTRPAAAEAGESAQLNKQPMAGNGLNSVDILGGDQTAPRPAVTRLPNDNQSKPQALPPLGTAEMLPDESLRLHLEAETADRKTHGDADLVLHPGDSLYSNVRKHIGDIIPGQIKFVSPWLDSLGHITNSTQSDVNQTQTGPQTQTDSQTSPDKKPADKQPGDIFSTTGTAGGAAATDVITPPSVAFDTDMHNTFNAMSAETKAIVAKSGAKVVAVHHLTDAMPELKGQAPRGWPAGATWDAVDGCWSGGKNEIIVAEERQSLANGKWVPSGRGEEVLRHETGHAVDFTIHMMSDHADFQKAYDADTQAIPVTDKNQLSYFLQTGAAGREETAAEGVADREGGATGGRTFHNDFPNTLKVINDTINGTAPGSISTPPFVPAAQPKAP